MSKTLRSNDSGISLVHRRRLVVALTAVTTLAIVSTCLTASFAPVPAAYAANSATVLASMVLETSFPPFATPVEKFRPHHAHHSSPTVVDLDGNGTLEVLAAINDGTIWAMRLEGTKLVILPGWPRSFPARIGGAPTAADLDGDGRMEIIVPIGTAEDENLGNKGKGGVAVLNLDGSQRWFRASPPFPETGETGVFSTPAVGDVNGDGSPDIAFASYNRFIYVVDRNGKDLAGWPEMLVDTTWSSPSLVSLDIDGRLSVVIGSDMAGNGVDNPYRDPDNKQNILCPATTEGLLLAFDYKGDRRPGFPRCLGTPIWSAPAVVKVNGAPTAFFGSNTFIGGLDGNRNTLDHAEYVHAIRLTDGQALPGWPVRLRHAHPNEWAISSPAVGDVDGDGRLEIAIGSVDMDNTGYLYLIGVDGQIRWDRGFTPRVSSVLGSPVISDIDGDAKPDIVVGAGDWTSYGFNAEGVEIFRFKTGSYFRNSPAVADLNGDGTNEIVLTSGINEDVGGVWVLKTSGSATPQATPWPQFRRTPDHIGSAIIGAQPHRNFDTNLILANPGLSPANVTVTLQRPSGAPIPVEVVLGPNQRQTVSVDEVLPDSEVSIKVEADKPIAAERSMFFNYRGTWDGGHTTHGIAAPATEWFLAEGYTAPNFDTYILLQNASPNPVNTTITLLKPDGSATDVPFTVARESRRTLNVKAINGFEHSEVSARVVASGPIVVERSVYFDYFGKDGGHDALGITELGTDWFLAEGYTGGTFDTYVLVANPNPVPARIQYTFLRPSGSPATASAVIPPRARGTIKVDDVAGLSATEVSTQVRSDVPVAVERAVYFDFSGLTGGHDAEGVKTLGSEWFLAEGDTRTGYTTFVLMANPGDKDAAVALELATEDGALVNRSLTVPARSRRTVNLNEIVPNVGLATRVKVTNGVGISVERSMYFSYLGVWGGGSDAQAVPAPRTTWYFAEGYTGS